jgi:hypothetical protein
MNDRTKFVTSIEDALSVLRDANDSPYVKGEYLGYFVNRLVKRFMADPDYTSQNFNSAFFNEGKKKTLSHAADSIAAMLNRADPIAGAGELHYSVTAVVWGFLGDADGFAEAGYGLRAYVTGILERVLSSISTVNVGNQRDMTMAFRRHLVIRGVLHNVLEETYRRKTAPYEDEKLNALKQGKFTRLANDIWNNGKLILETSTAVVPAE